MAKRNKICGKILGKGFYMSMIDDKVEVHRCSLCDEWYDVNSPRAKVHEHPEPQSGNFRDIWIRSKLPYHLWIDKTQAGYLWHMLTHSKWPLSALTATLQRLL